MKKLFFAYAWLLLSTGTILTGIAGINFFYLTQNKQTQNQEEELQSPHVQIFEKNESEQGEVKGVETIIESDDARAIIVANFLKRYNSPLKPYEHYGRVLVEIADKYEIDFRLLPAIMMQESNLCKKAPAGSYNCLGFGIHEKGTLTFNSYEESFDRAARELKKYYIDQGRLTTEDIMKKYTPHSDGSWANSVNQWMAEMKFDDRSLGKEKKTNANVLEYAQASESAEPSVTPIVEKK
ncbi:MAG: hypothetical protein PVJ09_01355 [Candidatus Woesebacteria bacterium]|jgi:hypothetical protein